MNTIRVGIVGLGANTRLRHVPGLRACDDVEISAVCNRSPESTSAVAAEFGIARTFAKWEDLVADPELDAVVIGTWPYLHCPITIAALAAGKHVLTEARMACNLEEARRMLETSRLVPDKVAQIVPSPFGLRAGQVVEEMIADGFLGELREFVVLGVNGALSDPATPIHWRQSATFSGLNMLTLGIVHETLIRWVEDPIRVMAQSHTFTTERVEQQSGRVARVETPDVVRVLTELPGGARGLYHFSGVAHFGPGTQIQLYGTEGTIKYQLAPEDRLWAGRRGDADLHEVEVPSEKEGCWRVEEEFINAIRGEEQVRLTDFETGVRYMQFTEAVARSAKSNQVIEMFQPRAAGELKKESKASQR